MHLMAAMIIAVFSAETTAPESWSSLAGHFTLGPAEPSLDLRNMLTRHIVQESCAMLDGLAQTRRTALAAGELDSWKQGVRAAVREALGSMPFGETGGPLNLRTVSRLDRGGYTMENVLFEALPGLDVNASVYLPSPGAFPPPWPAIVIPVGHSNKAGDAYQKPAQAFARLGYAAITFDPPGAGGEKQPGNDHFRDGVRCYLTGASSNRYFVLDALRCIDYLATRPDIDMTHGVGMTGVSGGGVTTMWATLLDERIRAASPSCCAVPKALHPVLDNYAECPEVLAFGRFAKFDDPDLLAAAMPTPVLLMAGAGDEVFNESMSRRMAEEVAASFTGAGQAERFSFFLDSGGHDYSLAMALEFTKWMDRWVRGTPGRDLPALRAGDLEMLTPEQLACHPRTDRNMMTITQGMVEELRGHRSGKAIPEAIGALANITAPPTAPPAREEAPSLVWFHYLEELLLLPEPGIELPGTFLYPSKAGWRGGAILYFDDCGRWADLRSDGLLAGLARMLQREGETYALLSVDLRGWGDTHPADLRYDLAGWGARDRWIGYNSAAMGDPVFGMRVRDGLAALAWLRARSDIDPKRIVVGGHGMGGVVALHVASVDGQVAGVFSKEGLASFESLAGTPSYAWSAEDFFPKVLLHYDLPELAAALKLPTLIARPLDAAKQPLDREDIQTLYASALAHGAHVETDANEQSLRKFAWACLAP